MPTKRTATQIRAKIREKLLQDNLALETPRSRNHALSPTGVMISGNDLQRAAPLIALIPDETDRRTINSLLGTFTKYQALAMLTEPAGKWMQKYPEIVDKIADEATAFDEIIEYTPRR